MSSQGQRLSMQEVDWSARQQAALALTEAVTRIADAGVPDIIWNAVDTQFSQTEIVRLLMTIATINVWNRLAVSTRQQPPDIH